MRSTSTGLLFLLGAYWLLYFLHRSWRQLLWQEGVIHWRALEEELQGRLRVRGTGWRIKGSRGHLQVRGGFWPVESRLQLPDGKVHKLAGIAPPDWVRSHLGEPTA